MTTLGKYKIVTKTVPFIGIEDFHKPIVEGTVKDESGIESAEEKAFDEMDKIIEKMSD
ncbi:hypothetical protein I6U48_03930 [Clostridium sp. PL3]|uniref:Uncharacterized protein n=1 Tax=Clostridium thailandense TaxID=2794346 RepID=A0A949TRN4_9CLOT|nr:hypothetical protein [Clostridium thailandense]MBV7272066.1 hypothetical protein [Clostridium thailandense]